MNLRAVILERHSKSQTDKIVKWVGSSQERFDELFNLFLTDEYRVVQRAAWSLSYCAIQHPELIKKHLKQMIAQLKNESAHPAVRRNVLRLLPHVSIPKKYHGQVMDLCFQFITTPGEKAAAKAFSLQVLQKLVNEYPEIKREVELIIHEQWDRELPSFRSRAKKFMEGKPS